MMAALLQRLRIHLRLASLHAHRSQLLLAQQHTALHHAGDLVPLLSISARLAEVELEITLAHARLETLR